MGHYRDGKEIVVFEGKVVNKPCTKSQQESKQQYCPISPAESQRLKQLVEEPFHLSLLLSGLLSCRISEILYDSLLAHTDLDILVYLYKNISILDLAYSTIDTADSHDLVTVLE